MTRKEIRHHRSPKYRGNPRTFYNAVNVRYGNLDIASEERKKRNGESAGKRGFSPENSSSNRGAIAKLILATRPPGLGLVFPGWRRSVPFSDWIVTQSVGQLCQPRWQPFLGAADRPIVPTDRCRSDRPLNASYVPCTSPPWWTARLGMMSGTTTSRKRQITARVSRRWCLITLASLLCRSVDDAIE